MAIFAYIVNQGGTITTEVLESQPEFDLMKDKGIYYHLSEMWSKILTEIGVSISQADDAFFDQPQLSFLLDIFHFELAQCRQIHVDKWTYCVRNEILRTVNGEEYTPDKFDSVSAYLSEYFVKSNRYEVIEATCENLQLKVNKILLSVAKEDLVAYLTRLIQLTEKCIENNKRLYFSYC